MYTKWEVDSETGNFEQRQNKTRSCANMVMSYFQRVRPQCKVESFYTTVTQKRNANIVDGFCEQSSTVFEAMGYFSHFCACQEACPSSTEIVIN